jgi:nucleotide-binding universal stress UspA family protein
MFKKILIPLDLTDRHDQAMKVATALARYEGGAVTLLHVIELIPGLSREDEPTFYNRLERMATSHLERWAATLAGDKLKVRGEVVFGNRVQEVVNYAARMDAELIVLTSPRLEANNLLAGWGSLSYRIGLLCACPVFLVK